MTERIKRFFDPFWPGFLMVVVAVLGVAGIALLLISAMNGHPLKCAQYIAVVTQHCARWVEVSP